jgi:hypothetical protein
MTAPSTTTKITKPVRYRNFIISPRNQGFDLIDPATGRWAHFDTQRFAKWSASFISNISTRMVQHPPLPADKIPRAEE